MRLLWYPLVRVLVLAALGCRGTDKASPAACGRRSHLRSRAADESPGKSQSHRNRRKGDAPLSRSLCRHSPPAWALNDCERPAFGETPRPEHGVSAGPGLPSETSGEAGARAGGSADAMPRSSSAACRPVRITLRGFRVTNYPAVVTANRRRVTVARPSVTGARLAMPPSGPQKGTLVRVRPSPFYGPPRQNARVQGSLSVV